MKIPSPKEILHLQKGADLLYRVYDLLQDGRDATIEEEIAEYFNSK